ncbi:MAG: hypothetical protein ACO1NO_13740 [Burkholderiaceae bacterium]
MRLALITAASILALTACGEPDQELSKDRYLPDTHASQGPQGPYTAKGWTAGDKRSWENQLRTRGQYQNEYNKVK